MPQLTSATEQQALPLLPSFLYAPTESEGLEDPFDGAPFTIGSYARRRGQEVPARLVASAKSWLGHTAVDRRAAILPWGSDASEVTKISPVEAESPSPRARPPRLGRALPGRSTPRATPRAHRPGLLRRGRARAHRRSRGASGPHRSAARGASGRFLRLPREHGDVRARSAAFRGPRARARARVRRRRWHHRF